MTDILEAAARALYQIHLDQWSDADEDEREDARELMRVVLAAVTPLIRAAALEEAAKVAEDYDRAFDTQGVIAAAIRAIQAEELDRHTLMGPPSDFNEL